MGWGGLFGQQHGLGGAQEVWQPPTAASGSELRPRTAFLDTIYDIVTGRIECVPDWP